MPSEDRQSQRERRAAEREETKDIMSSFRMNLDDTYQTIIGGATSRGGASSDSGQGGFVDPAAARLERQAMINAESGRATGPLPHHLDWGDFLDKINPKFAQKYDGQNQMPSRFQAPNTISIALSNRASESYTPVVQELSRFKFAANEDKRSSQMNEIVGAVRDTLRKLAIREVASNSRRFYDNIDKFYQTNKGIKVTYNIGQVKVALVIAGEFNGDEIVCLEQDGTNVTGYVARQSGENFEDITGQYDVRLEVVK